MRQDIWRISALFLAALVVGLSIGYPLQVLLVTSVSLLGWQLYRLNLLLRWIRNPSNEPLSEHNGLLYLINREVYRRNSEHHARTKQLTTHLLQFRKAVSVIPDAIVLVNQAGKIEWANSKAHGLLGIQWPRDAQVRFTDLIRDSRSSKLLDDVDSKPNGIEITSPINRDLTLSITCTRYMGDEVRMVIARDISHLIRVNKLHKNFVANVSHELKTPLTVLKGYLEIMGHNPELPEKFRPPVEQMTAQSNRMQLIVRDLLYLAKLEDHSYMSEHQPVDITQLVNSIIESIQPVIERKRHKIQLDIDYQLKVLGSQSELHSAFTNLISNAAAYTDDGGVINISWKFCDGGAEFMVKDNGVGIESVELPLLTRRFYRIDDDRSRDSGGTGLGLAIVKHVLQRHGAELRIDSLIGVGSEFRCVFPPQKLVSEDDQVMSADTGI